MKTVIIAAAATFLWAMQLPALGNAQASATDSPANRDVDQPVTADPKAPGEPSDPADEDLTGNAPLENPKQVFEKVEFPCDAEGHPLRQTIRLNEKVIFKEGERYSGFWFVVDRGEFARKQGIGKGKEKLSFYWYFLPPKPLKHWAVGSILGVMHGGWSYCPLKLNGFTRLRDAPPADKNCLILQQLDGSRLKEGKEYYMEFGFPVADTRPVEMTFCMGFRPTIGDFKTWDGHDQALHFLGLEHKVSKADSLRAHP